MSMHTNTWIVITSINKPTPAVVAFAAMAAKHGWHVLVVGDTKTPADYHHDHVEFLSIEQQHALYGSFSQAIPVKHYCRKNIGYLYAIKNGAEIIIDTDDDNLPYETFAQNMDVQMTATIIGGTKWANIYSYYSDQLIWPRGLSLDYIHEKGTHTSTVTRPSLVQQYLADSDPDVDAIYRLLYKNPINFNKTETKYLIEPGTYVPFNSQNTIFFKEAFPLLYLPCFVSFRMTDIWRSFIAQRLLPEMNSQLSFGPATVWQDRNAHNLMKDFGDEVVGYLNNDRIIAALDELQFGDQTIKEKIVMAWKKLHSIDIVNDAEMEIIESWLNFFE